MEIVTFAVAALCVLFTLISVAIPVSERLRIPLPVVLGTVGLTLGLIGSLPGFDPLGSALDAYNLWIVGSLALDGQTLLLVFLPPLLFEMALGVNVRRLIEDVAVVVLMAVVAVVLATGFVGLALWGVSSMGLVACLLLGAAISTTDPAAVVTTFRQIGAPRRLLVILEGESLLNDAAAIALFTLLIGLTTATEEVGEGSVVIDFLYSFGTGALCGITVAWLASRLYSLLGGSAVAEVTMTVALAYGSYLIAQEVLVASGVVSVVFAGLTTTVVGTVRMGPRNWSTVVSVWTQVGFWANALILVLAATVAPMMLLQLSLVESLYLIVVFAGAFAARAVVLFGMLPALSLLGMTTPITPATEGADHVGRRPWRRHARSGSQPGRVDHHQRGRPARDRRSGRGVRLCDASAERVDAGLDDAPPRARPAVARGRGPARAGRRRHRRGGPFLRRRTGPGARDRAGGRGRDAHNL